MDGGCGYRLGRRDYKHRAASKDGRAACTTLGGVGDEAGIEIGAR